MAKSNLTKKRLENFMSEIINEYGLTFYGETISPLIQNTWSERVYGEDIKAFAFADEGMEAFVAGNIASSIYDKFEAFLAEYGYETFDSDGATVYLQRISK